MFARNPNRWLVYFVVAGALHGSALLFRGCTHSESAQPIRIEEKPLDAIDVRLLQDPPQGPPGPLPGGGSTAPRLEPRPSVPEPRAKPIVPARPVARAPVAQEPVETSEHQEETSSPEPFATDMLAQDQADTLDEVRPHAARRQTLPHAAQTLADDAPDTASDEAASSAFKGSGPGVNGGPGGVGRGQGKAGVVDRQFAFGGPTGSFRADVCFIEPTVRLLTDITSCTPVTTFFTNALNVAPRRFDQGFPGLGLRTQWFAIKYHGKFSVSVDDSYTFRLLSDDGARLEIDGRPVLNNDGQHQPIAVSVNVRLSAGEHEFFLFYYQGPPDFVALQLFVKRFAHEERLFGPAI